MPVHNAEIASAFNHLADLLEIEGANPFRVRAYRNAARTIGDLPHSVADMLAKGEDLAELPGIGEDLAAKIADFVETKRVPLLEEVKRRTPAGLVELTAMPGIGPKRAKVLFDKLKIRSVADLKKAAAAGKLHGLAGFGTKIELKLGEELKHKREAQRFRLDVAEDFAESLLEHLKPAATGGARRPSAIWTFSLPPARARTSWNSSSVTTRWPRSLRTATPGRPSCCAPVCRSI